jgi:acyl-CoA thioesterase
MEEQSKMPVMDEETARAFFQADAFVKLAGIEIEKITADSAVITAKIGPQHLNANGFVQGGMLYTIADFAFAVHANFLHPTTVTQGGHINYVRAAKTTALTAVAKETLRSGHNTLSEVIIKDDQDQIVCVCNFNGFVKDVDVSQIKRMTKEEQ